MSEGVPSPGVGVEPGRGIRWDRLARFAGAAALVLAVGAMALSLSAWGARHDSLPLGRLVAVAPLALGLVGIGLSLAPIRCHPAVLAAFVSAGAALAMAAYHLRPDGAQAWVGDASAFHRMAEEWPWRPGGWWRYRILVPWVVHVLPCSVNFGYFLVAVFCVAASGPVLSLLLRDLGYGTAARHAGVALYLASFAPLYNTFNYALPDPAAMAVLLLAARALARGRDLEFGVWLVVGVLTKEVVLFLVPVRWLWRRAEGTARAEAIRTVLVAAPAGLVFLVLRAMPSEAAALGGLSRMDAWLFPWKHQPDNVARLFSPFAAGWALVALGCVAPSRWIRAGIPFAALVGGCLLVTDAGRMLVYLVPFAVPAMLDGIGFGCLGADVSERTTEVGIGRAVVAAGLAPPGHPGRLRVETAGGASPAATTTTTRTDGDTGHAPNVPGRRAVAALALAALSMKLWEPFLVLWVVPVELRRGAALLLVPAVLVLAWGLARRGGATARG